MLKGNNFFNANIVGLALAPVSLDATDAANGVTIPEPWRLGRQITFILLGATRDTSEVLTVTFEGRLRGTNSWETMKDHASTPADLSLTSDADFGTDQLSATAAIGTLDMTRLASTTYDAIRVSITQGLGSATAQLYAAAYVISDLFTRPSGQVDYLFDLMQPH